tara:strand:- start:149 stop:1120 length:972 start_codon:yes stop_codon:yes gene_type:complete
MIESPPSVQVDEASLTNEYGRFRLGPLCRGIGVVTGTSLRRILLSSIPGFAMIGARIGDIYHEFTTVPGVLEDVTEIVLNLKQVIFKSEVEIGEPYRILKLEAEGPGEVTAGDIGVDDSITIINPNIHIATLDAGIRLSMDLYIQEGRGYKTNEDNLEFREGLPIGVIGMDASFSPINVVNARVYYDDHNREWLELDVLTNGACEPERAVSLAAAMMYHHLHIFNCEYLSGPDLNDDVEDKINEEIIRRQQEMQEVLDTPLEDFELSIRSERCLNSEGIETLRDLVQRSEGEIKSIRNVGSKSLREIRTLLVRYNLHFDMTFG